MGPLQRHKGGRIVGNRLVISYLRAGVLMRAEVDTEEKCSLQISPIFGRDALVSLGTGPVCAER